MKEEEKIIKKLTGQRILRISVNSFLYFVIGIILILLISFGFTQTSVFRDWLKNTIVEELNATMNGEISIDELEGTIFTSIVLKNTLLTQDNDTVLSAEHIEIKTSPLKLLFKIIYLRKIEIRNTSIFLREDKSGILNVSKLFPPSEEDEDTTSSEFPFAFQVADLYLNGINITLQEYSNINSDATYESVNLSDLRINKLNFRSSAFTDISKNSFQLSISEFSFSPNFKFFNLEQLKGEIFATQNGVLISGLHIITEDSDITLNAGMTDINLFTDFTVEELGNAPLRLKVQSDNFNFGDLSTFIPELSMMQGQVFINLIAEGSLNDLSFNKCQLGYNNSIIILNGELTNTLDFNDLTLDADLSGSIIDPDDPLILFPSLGLPSYSDLGIVTFDTLLFKGHPIDFETKITLTSDKGDNISGFANLNFKEDQARYDINLKTTNLNIHPFTGLNSNLNSRITMQGTGFSPSDIKSVINITADKSSIGDSYLEKLESFTKADNGDIECNVNISIDTATTFNLISKFDFTEPNDPSYSLEMMVNNLNIGKIINDKELESKFNFELQAEGKGFDPDSLDLFMFINFKESFIYDFNIDSTLLIVDVRRNDNGNKIINIISDIADLTISGQYSIVTLADVILAEIETLQSSIFEKYSFLFQTEESKIPVLSPQSKRILALENISLDYLVDFKDLLTLKLGDSEIEIDGSIVGNVIATQDSILFSSTVDLNYFKYWDNIDLYFFTRTKLDINLWNKIQSGSLEDFSVFLNFRTNRFYSGNNFYNLGFLTTIENNVVSLNFNAQMEDYLHLKLQGSLNVNEDLQKLVAQFDSIKINYNNLKIKNSEKVVINYKDSDFNFENVNFSLADGIFNLAGNFGFEGEGLVNFYATDLEWRVLGRETIGIEDDSNFDSKLNLDGQLRGNIANPILSAKLTMNDLIYQKKNLGTILSDFSFANNELRSDIKFIDSLRTLESPKLKIFGKIPVELSSTENENESSASGEMDIKIISEDFDLSSLGNAVPFINDLTGKLNINMSVAGTIDDPFINGFIDIHNTSFIAENNNLRYNFEAKALFNKDVIQIENVTLGNVIGTRYGGTLVGNGNMMLDKLRLINTDVKLKGDLKILDKVSRDVNPIVYGDLAFQTNGEIHLTINDQTTFVDIPINVTVADLIFTLPQTAYQNTSGFIYRFPEYIDSLNLFESGLDSLVVVAEQSQLLQTGEQTVTSNFDYSIRVDMKTEVKMVVVLSKELNQNLTAMMDGNFELISRDGRTVSTGQLNLLEGSKLSFIKTFEVVGNVRVEKLDNPILNIIAIYRNYYYPADTTGTADEVEVAVKIRFNGPLNELSKNFIKDEENIAVYVGSNNIEKDERDPTKTTSDAFLFLIAGKFTDGATTQEINAAASTAASLAGSVLGGVLNKYLGDYVRSVQLRQVGSETKFNLIGKVGKFKYEIGGSTDVFQDLSRANVKIEYPVIQRLLLRLERKEAINETTLSNDLFNELGLKYRFDF